MKKWTVFYDQLNKINYQVFAKDKNEAKIKADKLFRECLYIPFDSVQEGWISPMDGEDGQKGGLNEKKI